MYLVILSCSMDDIPVCITLHRSEAVEVARILNKYSTASILKKFGALAKCDPTEPVCWKVATFTDAQLSKIEIVIAEDDVQCESSGQLLA